MGRSTSRRLGAGPALLAAVLLALAAAGVSADDTGLEHNEDLADIDEEPSVLDEPETVEAMPDSAPLGSDAAAGQESAQERASGSNGGTGTTGGKAVGGGGEAKKSPPKAARPTEPDSFLLESVLAVCMAAYLGVYFVGSSTNSSIAAKWTEECADVMEDNFEALGNGGGGGGGGAKALVRESAYEFVLYGTGRRNCKSLSAKLELPQRHDVAAMATRAMKVPAPDVLTLRFELAADTVPGFVLAVLPSRQAKRLRHNLADIRLLTKTYPASRWGLPDTLSVATDCPDIVSLVLTDRVTAFLAKAAPVLDLCVFSDCWMGEESAVDPATGAAATDVSSAQPALVMRFRLGGLPNAPTGDRCELLRGGLALLDAAMAVTLTAAGKRECARKRQEMVAELTKPDAKELDEQAKERVLERQREEKERFAAMDENSAARKAYERKQERKQEKKKKGAVKLIKR